MRLFFVAAAAIGLFSTAAFAQTDGALTHKFDIIGRLLLTPPCLATRWRLFLLSQWTRTMAVAITRTGRLGMG